MKDEEQFSERIIVPMSPSMVKAIKDYWHANQFDSRADAIRHLLQHALWEKSPSTKKKG